MGLDRNNKENAEIQDDKLLNQYADNLDIDTEGIWTKIEAGLGQKSSGGSEEKNGEYQAPKKKKLRYIGAGIGIAAVVFAAVLVTPLLKDNRTKSENAVMFDNSNNATQATGKNSDTAGAAAEAEQVQESVTKAHEDDMEEQSVPAEIKIVTVKGEIFLGEVTDIAENTFGVSAGQEISVIIAGGENAATEYKEGTALSGMLCQTGDGENTFYLYVD